MSRYYVSMTWDDWPEGGSYATVIETDDGPKWAETECQAQMAAIMARNSTNPECDTAYFLEEYGDEWHVVDCFDLDDFIKRQKRMTWCERLSLQIRRSFKASLIRLRKS